MIDVCCSPHRYCIWEAGKNVIYVLLGEEYAVLKKMCVWGVDDELSDKYLRLRIILSFF